MQRDPTAFTGNPSFAYGDEANGCMKNGPLGGQCSSRASVSPAFGVPAGMTVPQLPNPLGGFEFQPSKVFPRNFIIFDHNEDKGRIMYHPTLANKLNAANINAFPSYDQAVCRSCGQDNGNLEENSSSFKEDTREIDALLSSSEESDNDDVVSTGRTPYAFESVSLDSSSTLNSKKMRYSSEKSSGIHGSMEDVTHESMRKMITVLRGVIPGADQLDTPAVLEEAVRYLKFLKMEAKKLGVDDLDN
ncbi:transcription factor bHLH144 [Brachypodium distachyon]|uniref:BHLH domain-containing protein n=1 Tax=Brachypodium distachyon TaxID=15368 RepID=I1HPL2_BRADI|nr:transcription factor bHLH144 [Brachypodium distachyon]KQK08820.1 hypothetical protein BRADI_2g44100v3 [Brachypodium distachyon]|eukprot:XP_003569396.1 transcription factor bHLH144 [Brachypodium distachyon]